MYLRKFLFRGGTYESREWRFKDGEHQAVQNHILLNSWAHLHHLVIFVVMGGLWGSTWRTFHHLLMSARVHMDVCSPEFKGQLRICRTCPHTHTLMKKQSQHQSGVHWGPMQPYNPPHQSLLRLLLGTSPHNTRERHFTWTAACAL